MKAFDYNIKKSCTFSFVMMQMMDNILDEFVKQLNEFKKK